MNEPVEQQIIQLLGRLVDAFETIAASAKGTHEETKRVTHRLWPERTQTRDAVVTRVLTAEDRAREEQGATDTRPIREWSTSFGDEPDPESATIGFREREYLKSHPEKSKQRDVRSKIGGQAG